MNKKESILTRGQMLVNICAPNEECNQPNNEDKLDNVNEDVAINEMISNWEEKIINDVNSEFDPFNVNATEEPGISNCIDSEDEISSDGSNTLFDPFNVNATEKPVTLTHIDSCKAVANATPQISLPVFRNCGTKKTVKELRRNCCPYCERFITNFGRHLVTVHQNEKSVQEYINVKADNLVDRKRKRAVISNKLRKEGNHKYNIAHQQVLIPTKRTSVKVSHHTVSGETYVSCKFCLGLYKKKYFYLHLQACEKYLNSKGLHPSKNRLKNTLLSSFAELITPNLQQASELLKKEVFPSMLKDKVSLTAQSDPLILLYGSRFYHTHRNSVKYTSAKMRGLARLLIETKHINTNVNNMYDCLKPENFNSLMQSIRNLSKYDFKSGECFTPGVVPPLCNSLKKCCDIMRSETIKNPDITQKEKSKRYIMLDGFHHLMQKEWAHEVSAIAEQSRKKQKINKEDVLPDSEDIRDFWVFLEQQCDSAVRSLKVQQTPKSYDKLSKILIAQVITLNRRRPGEVCSSTIENYAQVDLNNDVGNLDETTLTAEEKKNAKDLSIFYISASKNRKKVPVILTSQMKQALKVLINSRENLDVQSHLLFPRPGNAGSYEGHDILGELKKKAVLRKPQHLTATGLRHHAATSSQLHKHDETYTKRLAKFMGHDLRTHENYYEIPLPLVQKGKVGTKLLDMTIRNKKKNNK